MGDPAIWHEAISVYSVTWGSSDGMGDGEVTANRGARGEFDRREERANRPSNFCSSQSEILRRRSERMGRQSGMETQEQEAYRDRAATTVIVLDSTWVNC